MYSFKEFCCKILTFNAVSKTLTDKGMSDNLDGILDELTMTSFKYKTFICVVSII